MDLTSPIDKQKAAVEANGDTCYSAAVSFAECLNRAYDSFWNKSDEELQAFLQILVSEGTLMPLFEDHAFHAASMNVILARYGKPAICKTGIARAFTVDAEGVVTITPDVVEAPQQD